MRNEVETLPAADEGPVQRTVRPLVERLRGRMNAVRWARGMDLDYATSWEPDALCVEAAAELERLAAALAAERERLLPERDAVGQLLCSVADNLGDMPISDEWAANAARAAHELLVRNDYFRA